MNVKTNSAFREFKSDIESALSLVGDLRTVSDETVHDVRKVLKKARADLRLLRQGIDEESFRQENATLRDAGRYFRPQRDAKSLIDVFESFRRRYAGELRGIKLSRFRKQLGAVRAQAWQAWFDASDRKDDCMGKMQWALEEADRRDFAHAPRKSLTAGLRRIYRQGREAFAEGEHARTAEALHEWRKQVKYLLNTGPSLDCSDDGKEPKTLKKADRLAHQLGDIHDLAALAGAIAKADEEVVGDEAKEKLQALISNRKAILQKRAFRLGRKLYRVKPKRFAAKLM